MRLVTLILLPCALLLAYVGCAARPQNNRQDNAPAPADEAQSGACPLIANAEIESVQGEAVTAAKGSARVAGPLLISQCFYQLPTYNKSVSLEVIRRAPAGPPGDAVREFWRERFHRRGGEEQERGERERERAGAAEGRAGTGERGVGREEQEEEEETGRPQPVPGIGDEAFWAVNPVAASLWVLKGDAVVRVSIGGPEDPALKIRKTRSLAEQALKRL